MQIRCLVVMKKKVYYGEYTLQHWINLMLTGNIELPAYQRKFVWSKESVKLFIENLKEDEYIPPITIGVVKDGENTKNLILDGQLRLSPIIFAYINRYPKKQNSISPSLLICDEDDNEIEVHEPILEWRFSDLLALGTTRESLMESTLESQYEIIDYQCSHSFFLNKRLGFSFIVPQDTNRLNQLKFYSTVFRNINILGTHLLKEESRKSLYFLDARFEGIFNPQIGNYNVSFTAVNTKMDFVRYLSILSDYFKAGKRVANIATNYKSRMEDYYEEYIYSVVNEADSEMFGLFSTIFPNNEYENDINRLKLNLQHLNIPQTYVSLIDMDIYMFGLIYYVLFEKKNINELRKETLKKRLDLSISQFKKNSSHKKNPSAQKYLRARVEKSISIYKTYAI